MKPKFDLTHVAQYTLYKEGKIVNVDKALFACSKSLKHLNDVNQRLLMLIMVYVSGDNYQSDVAHALVKMGRGEEALQEMFKQKMSGR